MSGEAARLTVGEALSGGGIVTLAGMLTVFAILVALVFVTKLIGSLENRVPSPQPLKALRRSQPYSLSRRWRRPRRWRTGGGYWPPSRPPSHRRWAPSPREYASIRSGRSAHPRPRGGRAEQGRRYFCGDCHSHGHRRHRPSDSFYQANRIIPSHKIICAEEYYYA